MPRDNIHESVNIRDFFPQDTKIIEKC